MLNQSRKLAICFILWNLISHIGLINAKSPPQLGSNLESTVNTADSLYRNDEYKEALILYKNSIEYFLKEESWDRYLHVGRQIGKCHAKLKDPYEAANAVESIITTINEKGITKPIGDVLRLYTDRSKYFLVLSEFERVIENSNQGLAYFESSGEPLDKRVGFLYGAIANVHYQNGDYIKALEYYKEDLRVLRRVDVDSLQIGIAHYNIGNASWSIGQYDTAIFHYEAALPIWKSGFDPAHRNIALLYNNLGGVYWDKKDSKRANYYFGLATDLERNYLKTEYAPDSLKEIGLEYLEGSESSKALDYFKLALDARIRDFGLENPYTIGCYNYIARAHAQNNDVEGALYNYHRTIQLLCGGFDDADIFSNPDSIIDVKSLPFLIEALSSKSSSFYQWFLLDTLNTDRIEAAYHSAIATVKAIDKIRNSDNVSGSSDYWNRVLHPFFESGILICHRLWEMSGEEKYVESAFQLMEKSKSILLLQGVRDIAARKILGIPDSIRKREQEIAKELWQYERLLLDEQKKCNSASDARKGAWQDKIVVLKRSQDQIIALIKNSYPGYYNLKFNTEVIHKSEIHALLGPNTLLLEYFMGGTEVFLFSNLNGKGSLFHLTENSDSLTSLISTFHSLISLPDFEKDISEQIVDYRFESEKLSSLLIAPALKFYSGNNEINSLVIIPDGPIYYLPFGTLLDNENAVKPKSFRDLPYLIRNYDISYLNSSTLLYEHSKRKRNNRHTYELLALAPQYGKSMPVGDDGQFTLNPLRYNRDEIEEGFRYFDGKKLISEGATKSQLMDHIDQANILHFAMHTIIDDRTPAFSRFLFDFNEDSARSELNIYELYNQSLQADLAILSACNTGTGKLLVGEGAITLARAFQYAGCPSVIMSLWSVDDASVRKVVSGFYHGLAKGDSKERALRNAKLEFIQKSDPLTAHPYFWAGMTLTGNNGPLNKGARSINQMLFLILIPASLLLVFYFFRRKTNSIS